MALVAALAVLFESISQLRGSLGNVVYFFLFIMGIAIISIMVGINTPLVDWLGFGLFKTSMAAAAKAAYPSYQGGMSLGMVPGSGQIQTFLWQGVDWNFALLLPRIVTMLLAGCLTLLGSLFFDRFDLRAYICPVRKQTVRCPRLKSRYRWISRVIKL